MAVARNSLFIQLHFIADTLVVHQGSLTNKKSVVQVGIAHYLLPFQFSHWSDSDQIVGLCVQSHVSGQSALSAKDVVSVNSSVVLPNCFVLISLLSSRNQGHDQI